MYDYIKGLLVEANPAEAIIEAGGIGFRILISLSSFSDIETSIGHTAKLYIHHHLREDDEALYGFSTKEERELFTMLISVNGVGCGTARMMLSSMNQDELQNAIVGQDLKKIKSIKGIGSKTAERIILELKDKVVKGAGRGFTVNAAVSNPYRDEAFNALVLLGFTKANVEKAVDMVLKEDPDVSLENLIKKSLKIL